MFLAKVPFLSLLINALVLTWDLNFGTILSDLGDVDSKAQSLTSEINAFFQNQTIFGAIPILTGRDALKNSIDNATEHATNNPIGFQFSPAQAQELGELMSAGLTPHVYALLLALEGKKQDFDAIGATSIVQSSIAELYTAQDAYSSALLALTPDEGTLIQDGQADKATIDGYFQNATTVYNTTSSS